jgi:serine/threonine protein kinase
MLGTKTSRSTSQWKYGFTRTVVLGKGGFSTVYAGTRRNVHTNVVEKIAVKRITETESEMSPKQARNVRTEVEVLQELSGRPNIIQLFGTFRQDGRLHLCMERCEGDLQTYIGKLVVPISENTVRIAGRQVASAVAELHRLGIVHRDLKPRNVLLARVRGGGPHLLDGTYELKLSDFGLASRRRKAAPAPLGAAAAGAVAEQSMNQTWCGTPLYMAPEVVYKSGYDERIDLYALGAMLYQLRTKTTPVRAKNIEDLRLKLPDRKLVWPNGTSRSLKDLCKLLLSNDPSLRPPASEVLQSHFFTMEYPSMDMEEYVMIESVGEASDAVLRHQLLVAAMDREFVGSSRRKYLHDMAMQNLSGMLPDKRHRLQKSLDRRRPPETSESGTPFTFNLAEHSVLAERRGDTKVAALLLKYSKLLTTPVSEAVQTTCEDVSNMLTAGASGSSSAYYHPSPHEASKPISIPAKFCYNCGTRFTNRTRTNCPCGYPRHTQSV